MQQDSEFQQCAERLKAIADPDRLKIVTFLFAGPHTVGDIATGLHQDLAKISHHLSILKRANIVTATKRGRFVEYAVHPQVSQNFVDGKARQIEFGCCRLDLTKTDLTRAATPTDDCCG